MKLRLNKGFWLVNCIQYRPIKLHLGCKTLQKQDLNVNFKMHAVPGNIQCKNICLKHEKKKEKKLNAAYTGWENNFVRVLHRENLSGTFFSRYLQVAVQSLKQKRPSEGRQAAGRETQLCSCAATFCSIFWCSCSGTHKETSIVSHPFGKLSLQPPTQRL